MVNYVYCFKVRLYVVDPGTDGSMSKTWNRIFRQDMRCQAKDISYPVLDPSLMKNVKPPSDKHTSPVFNQ